MKAQDIPSSAAVAGHGSLQRSASNFIETHPGRSVLSEYEVKMLLKEAGLPVPKGAFIKGAEAAAHLDLMFPLAAKISVPGIASKSNVGGVRLGIRDRGNLENAVADLMRIPGAAGVLVEEMSPPGVEVIVGGIMDSQFGPVVMFGLGGIFVELFRDVAFALAPMTRDDALWLIRQVKGYRLLEGYRGSPPVDIDALAEIIISIAGLMASRTVEEIDLNPVALYPRGAMVLDAKMLLKRG